MPTFRKRPVEIEAHQWFQDGDHPEDGDETFTATDGTEKRCEGRVVRYYRRPAMDSTRACRHCGQVMNLHGWIDTMEGGNVVCPGDWVITGVSGERYPCKPDIFSATYEEVK